jgi:hypothetical protein
MSLLLVVVFVLQGIRLQHTHKAKNGQLNFTEQQERADTNTTARLKLWQQLPGFGFDNIIADWAFLQFLQYFGDEKARNTVGYELSPVYFENIIPRDPYYVYNYLFLSGSSSIFAGQPEAAIDLMEQGLSHMSPGAPERGYMVWRYKGTDELLFLGDTASAQQSFENAADWARQSTGPEAEVVSELSRDTAQYLADNPVSKRAQIDAWGSVLTSGFSEETQRLAIQRIESLGGMVEINSNGTFTLKYPQSD